MGKSKKHFPPYVSYKTFKHFIAKLRQDFPTRIDRAYWGEMYSGSTGTQLMLALRFLNLMDDNTRPLPRLKLLSSVLNENRATLLRQVAEEAYAFVLKETLDTQNATYAELEDIFQDTYNMKSEVCRKCIKFFVEFSKDAGIPLSQYVTHKWKTQPGSVDIKRATKKVCTRGEVCPGAANPPGKYLMEEIVARNLSQEEFARRARIPINTINEIIKGEKSITAKMALQLEEAMPSFPARFWMYLQSDFQLAKELISEHSRNEESTLEHMVIDHSDNSSCTKALY